nr:expressed protein [Hymenolepis microstoma]
MSKNSKSTKKSGNSSDEQKNQQNPDTDIPCLGVTNTNFDVDSDEQAGEEVSNAQPSLTEISITNMLQIAPSINVSIPQCSFTRKRSRTPGQIVMKSSQLNAIRTFQKIFRDKSSINRLLRLMQGSDQSSGRRSKKTKVVDTAAVSNESSSSQNVTTQSTFLSSATLSSSDDSTLSFLDTEESTNDGVKDDSKENDSSRTLSSDL